MEIFAECFTIPVGGGECSGNNKQEMFTLLIKKKRAQVSISIKKKNAYSALKKLEFLCFHPL